MKDKLKAILKCDECGKEVTVVLNTNGSILSWQCPCGIFIARDLEKETPQLGFSVVEYK